MNPFTAQYSGPQQAQQDPQQQQNDMAMKYAALLRKPAADANQMVSGRVVENGAGNAMNNAASMLPMLLKMQQKPPPLSANPMVGDFPAMNMGGGMYA